MTVSEESRALFTNTRLVAGFTAMKDAPEPTGMVELVLVAALNTVTVLASPLARYTLLVRGLTATFTVGDGGKVEVLCAKAGKPAREKTARRAAKNLIERIGKASHRRVMNR